ncbi:hypothetical protein BDP27DRAFT_133598 [Rhodocollybia butyracea]|uniref:Uncharacterized protein n=1 Tax=Rhodocollybia butyracea TaxID=206335 RepID=A0A9P5U2G1_9AGAR|nr:hypothetical protein BDP27DRAFT_133598 [Rhodocollybia butyracea]
MFSPELSLTTEPISTLLKNYIGCTYYSATFRPARVSPRAVLLDSFTGGSRHLSRRFSAIATSTSSGASSPCWIPISYARDWRTSLEALSTPTTLPHVSTSSTCFQHYSRYWHRYSSQMVFFCSLESGMRDYAVACTNVSISSHLSPLRSHPHSVHNLLLSYVGSTFVDDSVQYTGSRFPCITWSLFVPELEFYSFPLFQYDSTVTSSKRCATGS